MYDILIVGAGPAGLCAAIYARRAGKSALILEKGSFGGQMTYSPKIENYPGFAALSGMELADKMVEQALNLGAEIEIETVTGIEDCGDHKKLLCEGGASYEGKTVIIATGAKHRLLGVPGEEALVGEGISFCAVCDGAFFEGKEVLVIGGGNSALQEAVLLSETSSKVTVVQNLDFLTGEQSLQDILSSRKNVSVICSATVNSFKKEGETLYTSITVKGEEQTLSSDGVFVAIGLAPDNAPFEGLVTLDRGYISATETCTTSAPGIFTAGDCRTKSIRQVATAISDGAVAALAACRYIDSRS
ncbi:MAG: FAD-dependent oxidoreductase [Clostridia bacterium]|nr:FAD-dependent oxidoreductase [Clostridia bacterium]